MGLATIHERVVICMSSLAPSSTVVEEGQDEGGQDNPIQTWREWERHTAVSWPTCVLNGNWPDLCVLRWGLLPDRLHFRLSGWGAELPKSHPPSYMSDLSPELLQGFRGQRASTLPGAFLLYNLLAAFFFFFCFIPSILALQSTLSSRNLLKSHPLMISVP